MVFDVTSRESFQNVGKWMEEVAVNTSNNIVIVLVGNKIDREEE